MAASVEDARSGRDTIDVWANRLSHSLSSPVDAVRSSLVWACGLPDPEARDRAVKRIAGNLDALMEGRAVLESTATDTAGWGLVQFVSVESILRRSFKTKQHERVCELRVRALSGPPSPDILIQTVSAKLIRFVGRQIGFTRPSGKRPFQDDRELSGLRALVLFSPADGKPRMSKYALNSYARKWNVDILNRRRRDGSNPYCPRSLPATVPCYQCTAGRSECPLAVRPKSLVQADCPKCKTTSWYDPARPGPDCLVCQSKGGLS